VRPRRPRHKPEDIVFDTYAEIFAKRGLALDFGGSLRVVPAHELAATVIRGLLARR